MADIEREIEAYEEHVAEYDEAMGNVVTEPEYGGGAGFIATPEDRDRDMVYAAAISYANHLRQPDGTAAIGQRRERAQEIEEAVERLRNPMFGR